MKYGIEYQLGMLKLKIQYLSLVILIMGGGMMIEF